MPRYPAAPQPDDERMTSAQVVALAEATPTTTLEMLAAAYGITTPTARKRVEDGTFAAMGIRPLKTGRKWAIPTMDIVRALGLEMPAPRARQSRKPRAASAA